MSPHIFFYTPIPKSFMFLLLMLNWLKIMVENLYNHFVVLYETVLPRHPSLAAEHALKQEDEIYQRTTKFTYRNVRPRRVTIGCVLRNQC